MSETETTKIAIRQEAEKVFEGLSEPQLFEFLTQFSPVDAPLELYPRLLRFEEAGDLETFEFNTQSSSFISGKETKVEVIEGESEDTKAMKGVSYTVNIPGTGDFYSMDTSGTLTRWLSQKDGTFIPVDAMGVMEEPFQMEFALSDGSFVFSNFKGYFLAFPDLNSHTVGATAKLPFTIAKKEGAWPLEEDKVVVVSGDDKFQICSLETYEFLGEGAEILGFDENTIQIGPNLFVSNPHESSVHIWKFVREKSWIDRPGKKGEEKKKTISVQEAEAKRRPKRHVVGEASKEGPEKYTQKILKTILGRLLGALPGIVLVDSKRETHVFARKGDDFEEIQTLFPIGKCFGFGDSFFFPIYSNFLFLKKGLYGLKRINEEAIRGFVLPPSLESKKKVTEKLLPEIPLAKVLVEVIVDFLAPIIHWNPRLRNKELF